MVYTKCIQFLKKMLSKKRQSSMSRESDEGNNRHSNVSQPKQSLASSNRPASSIGASSSRVKGRKENIKDPRPTNEKAFQENARREILEVLMKLGFPHEMSQKILLTPTNSDFKKIVEFLCSFMCLPENFKLEPKLEESLPELLNILEYPVTIPKRLFQTVGAPHGWHTLLALLDWMRTVIMLDSDVYEGILEDFSLVKRAFYEFCVKAYNLFLNGQDDYTEEIEEFKRYLVKDYDIDAQNQLLKVEVKKLEEEITEMRPSNIHTKAMLNKHEAEVKANELKKDSLSNIIKNLKDGTAQTTASIEESEKQIENYDAEIAQVLAGVEKCEGEVIKQSQLGFDVLSLASECRKSRKELDDMEKQIEAVRNEEEALAEELAKCDDEMKILMMELRNSLLNCQYLSTNDENKLLIVRPELSEVERMKHSLDLVNKLINEKVKVNLMKEKSRVNDELKSSDQAKDRLMQELKDIEGKVTQLREQKKSLETRINSRTENNESQLRKLSEQIELHAAYHAQSEKELEEANKAESAIQKELMDIKAENTAKCEQWNEEVKVSVFIVKSSKEKAEKIIHDCEKQMERDRKNIEKQFQELLKKEQQ